MKLPPARTTHRHRRRYLLAAATASALLLGASLASAATVTKTSFLNGVPGFPTAPGGLGVFEALTPVLPPDAVREVGTYSVTVTPDPAIPAEAPFAGTWTAYGVTDVRYHTDNGVPSPMELQLAADAWAGEFGPEVAQKLTWLLRNADALIAAEADAQRAAAAIQVVVWQTLRNPQSGLQPRVDLVTPTVDDAVNALAVKFTTTMETGLASAGDGTVTLQLTNTPSGCSATFTLTGTPGVPVRLTIDNGGVLSTTVVTIGPAGTAQFTASTTAGITATVTASAPSGGVLVRADGDHAADAHTTEANRSLGPEELIFLAGAQPAIASSPIVCPGPPVTPPVAPPVVTPPVVNPVGQPTVVSGTLRLTKAAPTTATAGQVITYRIRVRNTGSVDVTSVVLRDPLPAGMTVLSTPAGSTIKNGSVVWQVGTLAPGAQKTVSFRVKIDRSVLGRRCNTASASAANASTVKATACSRIRAVAGVSRVPVVTG